ncbi:MAG: hypothetical protein ACYTDU_08275 [Planctomycetota bacterium]|jgi:hypothetical protein
MPRTLALLTALLCATCGDAGRDDAPQAPEPAAAAAKHDHQPLRGGRLVEIGEHVAQVEIVHDAEAGTLTAYVMDGHASRAVRLPAKSLPVRIEAAGEEFALDLKPVADALTGETVGDTSRFEIQADLLKRTRSFRGVIVELDVFDRVFRDVTFTYAPE